MTQETSSLMDGELEPQAAERLIKGANEAELQAWYLYHVIGDTMRGHPPRRLDMAPPALEAVEREPTVLAPRRRLIPAAAARIAFAAAASLATVGVVVWIGTQGGPGAGNAPLVAKSAPAVQPVAVKAAVPVDVQAYLAAHRQIPSPDLYRPVNNNAPAR